MTQSQARDSFFGTTGTQPIGDVHTQITEEVYLGSPGGLATSPAETIQVGPAPPLTTK